MSSGHEAQKWLIFVLQHLEMSYFLGRYPIAQERLSYKNGTLLVGNGR